MGELLVVASHLLFLADVTGVIEILLQLLLAAGAPDVGALHLLGEVILDHVLTPGRLVFLFADDLGEHRRLAPCLGVALVAVQPGFDVDGFKGRALHGIGVEHLERAIDLIALDRLG